MSYTSAEKLNFLSYRFLTLEFQWRILDEEIKMSEMFAYYQRFKVYEAIQSPYPDACSKSRSFPVSVT